MTSDKKICIGAQSTPSLPLFLQEQFPAQSTALHSCFWNRIRLFLPFPEMYKIHLIRIHVLPIF